MQNSDDKSVVISSSHASSTVDFANVSGTSTDDGSGRHRGRHEACDWSNDDDCDSSSTSEQDNDDDSGNFFEWNNGRDNGFRFDWLRNR